MKKYVSIALAMFLFTSAFAQSQRVNELQLERFTTVSVGDYFKVKLVSSPYYSVRFNTDERIATLVSATVKKGVLTIDLDEKGYSAELKKALKGKDAVQPVLDVEVYMPTIEELILSDNAVLVGDYVIRSAEFALKVKGHASISQLRMECASAEMEVSNSAQVGVDAVISNTMTIKAANSAQLLLSQKGGKIELDVNGSSIVKTNTTVSEILTEASGTCEVHMTGLASLLMIEASGSSLINAEALETVDADVIQSGSSDCFVNATEDLKVNLTGGSKLTFSRNPRIQVDRIVSATMLRADDVKKKKKN